MFDKMRISMTIMSLVAIKLRNMGMTNEGVDMYYYNKAIEINKVLVKDEAASIDSTLTEFVTKDVVSIDDIRNALKDPNMGALLNSFQNYSGDKATLKDKLSKIKENIKYDLLIAKRNALFYKTLPFFEKAYSIQKEDQLKSALKEIYARMNMLDKVKALDQ